MVCLTADVAEFDDLSLGNPEYPCHVQVAVDWFGPTDFLKMDEQFIESGLGFPDHSQADSPESRYIGARITDVPAKVQRANPMTYIHADMPPILNPAWADGRHGAGAAIDDFCSETGRACKP